MRGTEAEKAFRAFVAGGYRIEKGRVVRTGENDALYEAFERSLRQVEDVDELVRLLTLQAAGPLDTRYRLWVPVLRRIGEVRGGDRDAMLSEILVHLIYGEDEDGEDFWREARRRWPDDDEVYRVGLLVGMAMRDPGIMKECFSKLPPDPGHARAEGLIEAGDWDGARAYLHYDPRRLEWFRRASEAAQAAGKDTES